MSCPVCGKVMCDHTPKERGQSLKEMLEDTKSDWRKERLGHKTPPKPNDTQQVICPDAGNVDNARAYPEHYPNLKDVLDW